jgi:hypothetical protein
MDLSYQWSIARRGGERSDLRLERRPDTFYNNYPYPAEGGTSYAI